MIIPALQSDRERLYSQVIGECFKSREDRVSRYNILENWYTFGRGDAQEPVEYNKLLPHIDLLSSFLFSGETTQFIIEIPNMKDIDYELEMKKAAVITPKLNDVWHDSNIDSAYDEGLKWALVFATTFVKLVPIGKNEYMSYVVRPHNIGVLREDIPTLTGQEAIAHEFFMTESQITRMIKDYGQEERDRIKAKMVPHEQEKNQDALPSAVQQIVTIASNDPTTGERSGTAETKISPYHNYEPHVGEKGFTCYELWIYDDGLKDYRKVLMLGDDTILVDLQKNPFFSGELPFVKITPNPLHKYFWGKEEIIPLIRLQEWINDRIPQIKKILGKLADPPVSGFGVDEAKLNALLSIGGVAGFDEPSSTGKVEMHYPQNAGDLFRELQTIEQMFDEISGIRSILKGGGEPGVRSSVHADTLAKVGSSRPKKKASILEDGVEKIGSLLLKCIMRYDPTYMKIEDEEGTKGITFIANQMTSFADVKVDAHSSSPIFVEQQIDKALKLHEVKAIDEEDLIDAFRMQNAGLLKSKLRKRMKQEAAMAKMQAAAEQSGGSEKEPGGLQKLMQRLTGGK